MKKKNLNAYDAYDLFLDGQYVASAHVKSGTGVSLAKKRACFLKEGLTLVMNRLEAKLIGTF